MSDHPMVLHHYEASPYAEKIRLLFGIADCEWQSVLSPPQPPRPNVDPLTGGYRRIPVAQMGADVFCDTALIAEEVARMTAQPKLAPQLESPDAISLVSQAEGDVFFAAITSVSPLRLIGTLIGNYGLMGTVRFIKDRTKMMEGGTVRPPRGSAAQKAVDDFMVRLNDHLGVNTFIAGEEISYADVAAYHPLWLNMRVGGRSVPDHLGNLARWYSAVEAQGQGRRVDVDPKVAFAAARDNDPRPLPEASIDDPRIGSVVSVAPADYGRDPVTGSLVWMGRHRLIIARDADSLGTLHVHFPTDGYEVKAV